MTSQSPQLILSTAPFDRTSQTTPRIMVEVLLVLTPVIGAAFWFFGVSALLVVAAATIGATLTERFFTPAPTKLGSLRDGSAVLTGVLLGLTLPPAIPLWMAFLGGVIGMALGKLIWGGLGNNLFNPALVGRAFLQAAFPTAITTWTANRGLPYAAADPPVQHLFQVHTTTLAPPMFSVPLDAVTTATPLGLAKFDGQSTELLRLLLGNSAGSLGETSALILILCGLWLAWRGIFDWRLPVATLLAVASFSGLLYLASFIGLLDPAYSERSLTPLFMLFSGGLVFAAVFMVTDPVTTPITPKGAWIFGSGVGLLVVLIRVFGGLPEGVMYAVLLMNATTPLINRWTQPRRFGG